MGHRDCRREGAAFLFFRELNDAGFHQREHVRVGGQKRRFELRPVPSGLPPINRHSQGPSACLKRARNGRAQTQVNSFPLEGGQPLRNLDVMLAFIRGTTTTAGLKVEAYRDEQIYRNGRKVTEEQLRGLALSEDDICPRWNYTLAPRPNR
jgi:hypothetical protein